MTRHGAWEDWLIYFLNGVARQSEDALSRSERINQLLSDWRERVSGVASQAPVRALDRIAGNPFVTIRGLEKALKTSYNTAARAVDFLVKKGVLSPVNAKAKRDRVFCAKALLKILE